MTSKMKTPIMTAIKRVTASLAVVAMVATMVPTDAFARDRGHAGGYSNGGHGGGHGGYRGGHRGGGHGYRSGHRGGHYGNRHYGHRRYRHHGYRHHSNTWIPFAFLGATALTYAITSNNSRTTYSNDNNYNRDYRGASTYAAKPCHVAYRDEDHGGNLIRMAATMCYDNSGIAYIVKGSEHQVAVE